MTSLFESRVVQVVDPSIHPFRTLPIPAFTDDSTLRLPSPPGEDCRHPEVEGQNSALSLLYRN